MDTTTTQAATLDDAQVGDGVRWTLYTDVDPGYIARRTKNTIWVELANSKLLNRPDSGEEDALQFSPGGFAGHTSGQQRYEFSRQENVPEKALIKFTRRADGKVWKRSGHPTRSRGFTLYLGIAKHYDYNF